MPKKKVKRKKSTKTDMDKITKAKAKLKQEFQKVRRNLQMAERDLKKYIHNNPKRAAKIATGIGAAIALGVAAAIKRRKK